MSFTSHLARHLPCPSVAAEGATVREVLEQVFAANPRLRGYVLDDQGALRQHVVIFLDRVPIRDRTRLSDPVGGVDELFVMQALSGG